jgi:hypothetical protein
VADWRKESRKAAIRHGIDPAIFERQIDAESGFAEDVIHGRRVSRAGAQGIAQFMPATAKGMGVNPLNPMEALDGAARLMASYVKKYGNWKDALTAYNGGPGLVGRGLPAETVGYIANIIGGANPKSSGHESSSRGTAAPAAASPSTTTTTETFDQGGFQDATKRALLGRLWASQGNTQNNPLFTSGLLSTQMPSRADFQGTQTVTTGGSTPSSSSTSGGGSTLVVGDSLGVGTTPYLKKDLGGSFASDTKVGRPSSQAASILVQKMASGNYSRVVFDAGTNDGSAKQLAQSISRVKQAAKGADVYIPTVRGPGAAQKNKVIRQAAGGNVHVVDWAGQSNGLVGGDGIHASGQGYQTRAQMLAQAMGTDGSGGGTVNTSQKGVASFEGKKVAAWIAPILQYARSQGWKGSINSGYRTLADQTRIYNSGVRPAAKPGTSNHEFTAYPGGAIDVSDAQALSNILRKSKYRNKLVYAGAKDPVHFSHPHNGSY